MTESLIDALLNLSCFSVKVVANSSENKIVDFNSGVVRIRIASPAEKGKANAALVSFLSKRLGRDVVIKSGFTSRKKLVCFCDCMKN